MGIETAKKALEDFPLENYGRKCAKIQGVKWEKPIPVANAECYPGRKYNLFAVPAEISVKLFKTKLGRALNKMFPKLAKGQDVQLRYTALAPRIDENIIKAPENSSMIVQEYDKGKEYIENYEKYTWEHIKETMIKQIKKSL